MPWRPPSPAPRTFVRSRRTSPPATRVCRRTSPRNSARGSATTTSISATTSGSESAIGDDSAPPKRSHPDMPSRTISIRGARTHNLKNVSVDIPQRQLTVLTGPSGSGKSSLAFNTLYAEGQRRFVESMSTYVRQFLERIDRPDVDEIDGILPAIAIEQKNTVKNARSTVATATELADHIRLFMTYAGETICPDCQVMVRRETPESITAAITSSLEGKRVVVLAPIFFEKENRGEVLTQLVKAGFYRAWIGGEVRDLNEADKRFDVAGAGHQSASRRS